MSKKIGTIRTGTALPVEYEGRIRHTIVEGVDDQDTLEVRLGKNSDETKFTAIRVSSTDTRGFLFEGSPGITLLKEAVWWIDSVYSANYGQAVQNLGTGGSALDAQLGSAAGADSNDPKFLDWNGENYLYMPGVNDNGLSVPDEAALDITGDIDLRVQVAMDDWTPANTSVLLNKNSPQNTQISYSLIFFTGGTLRFSYSTDGSSGTVVNSNATTVTNFADGERKWVRVTLLADNGSSGHDVKFFTSDDGVSWSQLGSTVTNAGTATMFSGSGGLYVSQSSTTSAVVAGNVYRAQIFDGIDGTPVLDIDTSVVSGDSTSFTALTGQTVTVNRATSGRKAVCVTHPLWLFGTDDYMEVADNALIDFGASEPFTILAVYRTFDTIRNTILAKKAATGSADAGYALDHSGGVLYARIADGTSEALPGRTITATDLSVFAVVNSSDVSRVAYLNGVAGATNTTSVAGSLSNSEALRVGRLSGAGTSYAEAEIVAAAIWRRALTSGEITTLSNYFSGRVS